MKKLLIVSALVLVLVLTAVACTGGETTTETTADTTVTEAGTVAATEAATVAATEAATEAGTVAATEAATVAETTVETVVDESVADESVADETAADETAADETVVDETVADETVADETVADETVADETVVDETVAETEPETEAETEPETEAETEPETEAGPVETVLYSVDLTQCAVSGHCPHVWNNANKDSLATSIGGASGEALLACVNAMQLMDYENVAMLYAGTISMGEIDLSKYTKVVITYTSDAGDATQANYAANGNNRVMLLSDTYTDRSPADESIIVASTDHVLAYQSWGFVSATIDLTDVNTTTDLYLGVDFLPGCFWAVLSIEFYGYAE